MLKKNSELKDKQIAIEKLDILSKDDLISFQCGLSIEDNNFLSFIDKVMFIKYSAMWKPANLKKLVQNEVVSLSCHMQNKTSKYQVIFDFINGLKKVKNLNPSLVFLYTLKSCILNVIGTDRLDCVNRTSFLGR